MPNDRDGRPIQRGDTVAVTAEVVDIHGGATERELVLKLRHLGRDERVSVSAAACVVTKKGSDGAHEPVASADADAGDDDHS